MHMLLLQSPALLATYLHRARYVVNIREVRCFLSFLSKYDIFEPTYVLEYGKRVFRVLYEAERDGADAKELVDQIIVNVPLSECDPVWALPADS